MKSNNYINKVITELKDSWSEESERKLEFMNAILASLEGIESPRKEEMFVEAVLKTSSMFEARPTTATGQRRAA